MATKKNVKYDPNELVEFEGFKDGDNYRDDITVIVNGRAWRIKRGVRVKIPRYVYEVIKNSMEQDVATAELIDEETNKFDAQSKALGYN